ncbi:bifunctional methylenetetrahydrofolate dehydrogenase/methenyltetrahydrofolate cyclohydrolase FolD [Acetobacter peroxydans]|uniref:bifunctional methylenetetrahydrofolate dehydrogenase/methenyltetrahydrofolate cyclohydrolase FolD n=1 Tax=Acetobacter peroxydans TaxID=104098 RepID=UPI00235597DC|nr:bifunctional methylenetetrahydrofolate dehydrogenase/methenyltetrahydrofolate cyclohydrolase FolD [Acetobacter peroxydans]MCH4143859.1 bifunctional methylenetetrahydrofolate dehydrogenase/methenyltetrahydrofolate cyclohydrolase FolD [Acetobacter peroxydans]MCI1411342.1 bifunctional methylenetetrahydrofolate dehydrogenase/methenyltetrahydrofolate cyclohydrolase FolD [Acetobacter peroxydans]MCI1566439.1 bifunctional methylenetetrahydrofolate dehydrogenase/methenyltetrahydrofolate cyclohydrolase
MKRSGAGVRDMCSARADIIDGKAFAATLRQKVAAQVARLQAEYGIVPGLAVVLVGEDPASTVYVRNKERMTAEVGMNGHAFRLPAHASEAELLDLVRQLNADSAIHGILVQLPLPAHMDARKVINTINPEKDVDGFHVVNAGLLATGQEAMVPCTPLGCLMLLRDRLGSLAGYKALVVGASNIVGKPMAQLLLAEKCTVSIAHSRTRDLEAEVRQAEILVVAAGRPELIPGDWIKPGAVVIDVGINRIERDGKPVLVGDVGFEQAIRVAGAITPVPGGVGPMTIACLLANALTACCRAVGASEPAELVA